MASHCSILMEQDFSIVEARYDQAHSMNAHSFFF